MDEPRRKEWGNMTNMGMGNRQSRELGFAERTDKSGQISIFGNPTKVYSTLGLIREDIGNGEMGKYSILSYWYTG